MKKIIALAGAPNCGKTTLFNLITKTHGAVGNRPGVTVEKKYGVLRFDSDFVVADLPGTYSLSSQSPEERAAGEFRNRAAGSVPDHTESQVIFAICIHSDS